MKTALVYRSASVGNTRKLVDELARRHAEVEAIEVKDALRNQVDYTAYDLVVLSSGIYFGFPSKHVNRFVDTRLEKGQRVYGLLTHGSNSDHYTNKWTAALTEKGFDVAGSSSCQGYYDMVILKPFGGVHRGHPTQQEVTAAVDAFDEVYARLQG